MPLPVLRFFNGNSGKLPLRFSLELEKSQVLSELKRERKFGVYLITESSAKELALLNDAICDRGFKPDTKSLAQLLLKQQLVPLIRCRYSSTGRLEQGVNAFLKRAAATGDRNLYFVAVPDALFEELWSAAGEGGRRRSRQLKEAGSTSSSYNLVLHLLPPVTVPRALEQTYVGRSLDAHLVRVLVMRAAATDDSVLILGDTGTGKEIAARSIHQYGPRSNEKFVPVNCGAIPRELFESELFGIKGGVATNVSDRRGLWEQTGRGTLFLDEVGELSPDHQVKVLRALEEHAIRRVGEATERKVEARIVAATNRELFSMVQKGSFRADLYYRLRVLTIPTPSLRDVPDDLPTLAQFLWQRVTGDESCLLGDDVLNELSLYSWPGNVRELKGILKNIHALFGADKIRRQHVRAVFELLGIQIGKQEKQDPADQVLHHRMECLQHLRRIDEVLRAIQVTIEPLFSTGKVKPTEQERVSAMLRNRVSELDLLLLRPLLFHDEVVFGLTAKLRDRIVRLQSSLGKDASRARDIWRDELAGEFQLALKLLFQEVDELMAV